jgi:hypothetical protein
LQRAVVEAVDKAGLLERVTCRIFKTSRHEPLLREGRILRRSGQTSGKKILYLTR